jgi:hypothetical protein
VETWSLTESWGCHGFKRIALWIAVCGAWVALQIMLRVYCAYVRLLALAAATGIRLRTKGFPIFCVRFLILGFSLSSEGVNLQNVVCALCVCIWNMLVAVIAAAAVARATHVCGCKLLGLIASGVAVLQALLIVCICCYVLCCLP